MKRQKETVKGNVKVAEEEEATQGEEEDNGGEGGRGQQ